MQTFLFYLSKILRPVLASPIFICLGLSAAALAVLPAETWFKRTAKRVGLAACATLFILSLPITAYGFARLWETPNGDLREIRAGAPYGAIVVLGGSVMTAASAPDRIELNDTAERLFAAAKLYKNGVAPLVLPSGGTGTIFSGTLKEAPLMADLLEELGVPADKIVQEAGSRNTYENATLSKPVLDGVGARRIVLVTSAWHMRRSAAIFRKAGYDFVPYAADSLIEPLHFPRDILPSIYALDRTTRILTEAAGYVAYKAMGRL